jgi:hypothetical protein
MGLFEAIDTTKVVMDFMSSYNLLDKLIPYVKDEGGNLSTLG